MIRTLTGSTSTLTDIRYASLVVFIAVVAEIRESHPDESSTGYIWFYHTEEQDLTTSLISGLQPLSCEISCFREVIDRTIEAPPHIHGWR